MSVGHQYLHGFMTLLSSFRNQESQYLQPLLAKASKILAAELTVPACLPAPVCLEDDLGHSTLDSAEGAEIEQVSEEVSRESACLHS